MPGNMGVIVHFAKTYMPADAVSIICYAMPMYGYTVNYRRYTRRGLST
jgi:hypothetical protein